MRLRYLAAGAAALLAIFGIFTLPVTASAELLIRIDKASQQMTVIADGEIRHVWPVSTGIARYDTPNGAFRPFRMERDHFSREWDDAPMPYSIFFTKRGHAIHGTNHKSLGQPASHGCVRLSVENAATLWALVRRQKMANTSVVLTGEIPQDAAPMARAEPPARARAPAPRYRYEDDDEEITGALPPRYRSRREARRWREYREDDRYIYVERPRRYYDRYGGWTYAEPPPIQFFWGR